MNTDDFKRIARLAVFGSMLTEHQGHHSLNSLLEQTNLNGSVKTIGRVDWVPSTTSTRHPSLRIECITDEDVAVVVWMSINENGQLTFDFS